MKLRKILTMVLILSLSVFVLTACGGDDTNTASAGSGEKDPFEGLTWYEHPVGVGLYMSEGFTETEVEGILGCYEGENSNVRFAREPFWTLEPLGYDGSMTLTEYGELILSAYQLEGEVLTDDHGNTYIAYTQEIQGASVSYYAYFDKTDDSYWMTTFMCLTEQAEEFEDDFALWAGSIKITAEPDLGPQKEELTEEETEDVVKVIEKIAPIDFLGKSFKPKELANDEMLRLTYSIFGAQQYGIVGCKGTFFNEGIAVKYFDYQDLEFADMVCSCGATLATYSAADESYDWEGKFHDYTAHSCKVYNEYVDAYKLDGQYVVTMYKLFPDLLENSSTETFNFYTTYEDAKNQQNSVITASNEEEFTSALASLEPSKKVLYTYTFEKNAEDDRFVLVNYEIGK